MLNPAMAGLILEIPQGIPVVKMFACLDLEQNIPFLDGHSIGGKAVAVAGNKES